MVLDFIARAFIAGIVTAIIAPLIGTFLVVRRYSNIADTLAHVSFLGVACGVALNIHPFISSIVVTTAASIGLEYVRRKKQIGADMTLSFFLYASLALALVLLSVRPTPGVDISSLLFGSITTVSLTDMWTMLALGGFVILTMMFLYKEYFVVSFNEDVARADGLPVTFLNMSMMVIAALVVAITMRIIGLLLIGALMTIPVFGAFQFKQSFIRTIIVSIVIALVSVVSGLSASLYIDIPSGSAIVLILTLVFLIALGVRYCLRKLGRIE